MNIDTIDEIKWSKESLEEHPTLKSGDTVWYTILKHEDINASNKEFFDLVLKRLAVLEEKYAVLKDLIELP